MRGTLHPLQPTKRISPPLVQIKIKLSSVVADSVQTEAIVDYRHTICVSSLLSRGWKSLHVLLLQTSFT